MEQVPRLAVLAVCLHEGRVLLVRRLNPPDQGLWGFPGGKVEFGEMIFAAAAREMLEETATVVEPQAELGGLEMLFTEPAASASAAQGGSNKSGEDRAVSHHFYCVAVQCRYVAGQVAAGDDAGEAAWFDVEQVLSGDLGLSARVAELLMRAVKANRNFH